MKKRSGPATSVLIVDEDPAAADALADILRFEGFAAEHARDGEAARSRLRDRHAPDVLLLDPRAPRVEPQALSGRRVVLMSADPQAARVARDVSAVAFLLKPLRLDRLVRLLGQLGGEGPIDLSRGSLVTDLRAG